ncbi:response regulator transcription factor [Candidatus Woesebacteria bacterium]|nr:response regulator transcription factor [Candidatus Woesebacteria bacterium]
MKILLVEDEHRIANNIKKGLELKNHVVDVAYDGESGYDFASSESYDVIILDRMLPKLDGIEITKRLRNEQNHTPILLLTAKTQVEDRVEGLEAGADDYLGKPFAFTELLARVRALGRRPQTRESAVITVDDLQINTSSYQVSRAGKPIELSKKEFALLEFFARHQGQVLSAEQIIQQVWEYDSDVLPNTAQVYIGYLRNKIDGKTHKKPLIKTIRGFGYSFGS